MPNIPFPYVRDFSGPSSIVDVREQGRDAQITEVLNSLALVTDGDKIEEEKDENNTFNLVAREYGVTLLSMKPFSHYRGVGGTRILRKSIINRACMLEGLHFSGEQERGPLVELREGAAVIFRDCIFDLVEADASQTWVEMEAGAKAIFNGCMWKGGPGAGNYVNNNGIAADCFVVSSIATATAPGGAFVNTTNVAVL